MAAYPAPTSRPSGGAGKKILIAVLAVVLLGVITVVGGGIYIGYRVKQKTTAALNRMEADGQDAPGGGFSPSNPSCK
jgi:hypothetical protein